MNGNSLQALWNAVRDWPIAASVRLACGLVFAYAGAVKLRDPSMVGRTVAAAGLLKLGTRRFGYVLGVAELTLGIGLFGPRTSRAAGVAGSIVGLCFIGFLVRAVRAKASYSCACFGLTSQPITRRTVERTVLLSLGCALAVLSDRYPSNVEQWSQAVLITSICLAIPLLMGAKSSIQSSAVALDEQLDWEWILQHDDVALSSPTRGAAES